jgi:hypothetical protein
MQIVVAAAVWYCPATQLAQEGCPVEASNAPGAQSMHLTAPVLAWYVPTAQLVHIFVAEPVVVEKVPTEQLTQLAWPADTWYWPATHELQVDCPVAIWYLPLAQPIHDAADPEEYCPDAQLLQLAAPVLP